MSDTDRMTSEQRPKLRRSFPFFDNGGKTGVPGIHSRRNKNTWSVTESMFI